jgi:hypothetical protein
MTTVTDFTDPALALLARTLLRLSATPGACEVACTINGGRLTLITPPRLPWGGPVRLWPTSSVLSPAQGAVLEAVARALPPLATAHADGVLIVRLAEGVPLLPLDWQERLAVGRREDANGR